VRERVDRSPVLARSRLRSARTESGNPSVFQVRGAISAPGGVKGSQVQILSSRHAIEVCSELRNSQTQSIELDGMYALAGEAIG